MQDAAEPVAAHAPRPLPPGTKVEVRQRFDGRFTKGFEVASVEGTDYRLRRLSDGTILPTTFARTDIRRERHSTWWR